MKIKLKLHPAQKRVWESDKQIIAFIGGIGSGKTYIGMRWLAREVIRYPKEDFLVVAPTYGMLHKVILPQALELYNQIFKGEYQVLKRQYVVPSGARIIFGSADNPLTLEGVHYKAVWFDEAGQTKREAWDVIRRRISLKKGRVLITTTPYSINWLKFEIVDEWRKGNPRIDVITSKSVDNPFFPKEEYERALMELPMWQFRMFYEGEFVKPTGLVYQDFDHEKHAKELDYSNAKIFIAGVDWGFNDPSAVVYIAELSDGVFYVYDEFYERALTPDEFVDRIKDSLKNMWRIYVDPSQPGLVKMLKPRATSAKNELLPGIAHISRLLRKGQLIISPKCVNLINEMYNYSWDEKKDKPKDDYNHLLDALRYALYTYSQRPLPKITVLRV